MKHSQACVKFVAGFEGLRLQSYQDAGGIWTIGNGHTAGVCEGQSCTEEQALAWLDEDLNAADAAVNRLVDVPLNQNEHDALVSLVFNIGPGNFEHSTLRKLINSGMSLPAACEFPKWDHVGGKVEPGLLRRRLAERDLFLTQC